MQNLGKKKKKENMAIFNVGAVSSELSVDYIRICRFVLGAILERTKNYLG